MVVRRITLKEAAEMLGVKHDSLRVAVTRGRLDAEKIGRDFFTTDAAIERYRRDTLGRHGPRPKAIPVG